MSAISAARIPPREWPRSTTSVVGDSFGSSLFRLTITTMIIAGITVPIAKVVHSIIDSPSRFIARINFRMYNVRLGQNHSQNIVDMCREALEAGFISQETMYVYKKQLPTAFIHGLDGQEREHRR